MRAITVATVQMEPELGQPEDNLIKMSDIIGRVATEQSVDLIVFPELITTGYEVGPRFTDLAQYEEVKDHYEITPELMKLAKEKQLRNLTFYNPRPKEQIPPIVASCDACLVPLSCRMPGTMPSKV